MAIRNWKDIPLFKDVTDEQWNDWHWQVEHRLSTVEEIAQVVNLSEQEKADIEKVIGGWLVSIRDDKKAVDEAKTFVVFDPMVYMY